MQEAFSILSAPVFKMFHSPCVDVWRRNRAWPDPLLIDLYGVAWLTDCQLTISEHHKTTRQWDLSGRAAWSSLFGQCNGGATRGGPLKGSPEALGIRRRFCPSPTFSWSMSDDASASLELVIGEANTTKVTGTWWANGIRLHLHLCMCICIYVVCFIYFVFLMIYFCMYLSIYSPTDIQS